MGKVISGFSKKQRRGPGSAKADRAFVTRLVDAEFEAVAADLADDVSLLCEKGLEARYGEDGVDERIAVLVSRLHQAVDGASPAEALVALDSFRLTLTTMCLAGGVAALVESPPLQAGDNT